MPVGVTNAPGPNGSHITDIKTRTARQRKFIHELVRGGPRNRASGDDTCLPPDTLAGFEQRPADHSGAAQGVAVVRRAEFFMRGRMRDRRACIILNQSGERDALPGGLRWLLRCHAAQGCPPDPRPSPRQAMSPDLEAHKRFTWQVGQSLPKHPDRLIRLQPRRSEESCESISSLPFAIRESPGLYAIGDDQVAA